MVLWIRGHTAYRMGPYDAIFSGEYPLHPLPRLLESNP